MSIPERSYGNHVTCGSPLPNGVDDPSTTRPEHSSQRQHTRLNLQSPSFSPASLMMQEALAFWMALLNSASQDATANNISDFKLVRLNFPYHSCMLVYFPSAQRTRLVICCNHNLRRGPFEFVVVLSMKCMPVSFLCCFFIFNIPGRSSPPPLLVAPSTAVISIPVQESSAISSAPHSTSSCIGSTRS
jgi:hypothetical protein